MTLQRRDFLKYAGAGFASLMAGLSTHRSALAAGAKPKVVVVGAGFGGATCAKYLRLWDSNIDVTLVEPNDKFYSCPMSNWVIGGIRQFDDLVKSYDNLPKYGIRMVKDSAAGVDTDKRLLITKSGQKLPYDRLILAPGIEFMTDQIEGYAEGEAAGKVLHAWKAGPQTIALRKQLEAMPNGGVFVIASPPPPGRCVSGPYERASQVAHYFKQAKPKSKIIILDGNPDIASKKGLFLAAWKKHYGYDTPNSMIEYRANNMPRAVDPKKMMVGTEFDDVKGDVINVVPPMRAAEITGMAGVRDGNNGTWCTIDYRTFESKVVPNVHVLGDSALTNFPKSGSVANNTGKMCAYAISEMFSGRAVDPAPVVTNTCYSASSDSTAFHVATVFRWNEEKQSMLPEKGANGVSKEESELEFAYMEAWAKNVWADTLGL